MAIRWYLFSIMVDFGTRFTEVPPNGAATMTVECVIKVTKVRDITVNKWR
jgi:hypothetical protein